MKPVVERKSLKQMIERYNTFGMIGVCGALLFYICLNFYITGEYGTAFYQYLHVSEFYEAIDNANGHLKDYLYTTSENSYFEYESEVENAQDHLDRLSNSDIDEIWRIQLLQNMLTSYREQAERTKDIFDHHNVSYEAEYSELLTDYELIKKTSDTYYEILTESMEQQNKQFDAMKVYVVLLSIVFAILLVLWLAYYTRTTTSSIAEPLTTILKNIGLIKQGSYDLTKISNTNSEMHALCEALDDMAEAVQNDIRITKEKAELEKKLLETENENLKKDELLAQSEVKMLQNQINPHFLFNTLNMTYKLALSEQAPKCSEMIERTSALLRYGLDKQNKMSDLQSEIKAVENYIAIQEKRLGERVNFELHVDQEVPNISIPGMILQPLVENSLKHGLKDCEEQGEIIISIRYMKPSVYIQISDNGEGMDPEACERMVLQGFHDKEEEHLGLYNVAKRLEMFYQNHVDISVDSSLGCGFSFIIKIEVS